MNVLSHCELCDNQTFNKMDGMRCGLTDAKPKFIKSCPDVLLSDKFEERIKKVNVELTRVERLKSDSIIQSVMYLVLGCAVIWGGYLFGHFLLMKGWIAALPVGIMGLGLVFLAKSVGHIHSYRTQLAVAKQNKSVVDAIVDCYGMDYTIDVNFGKEYHGTTEVEVQFQLNRRSQ